ncbi:MAG: hypothetical protein RLZZ126_1936 [Pseudomonadota bacterium]|jgi:CRP/FNR family transcriptional regulator, cyclic AMP receptor protein
MQMIDWLGWLAAALVLLSFSLKTMVSLRLVAAVSNVVFFSYGWLAGLTPICVLHGLLLPINLLRLQQLRDLLGRLRRVSKGQYSLDMLLPFATQLSLQEGERLFSESDAADAMYLVLEGEIFIERVARSVGPGGLVGEMGIFSAQQRRMSGAVCTSAARLGRVTIDRFWQVFTQDPAFGTYVVQTILERNSSNSQLFSTL